ncbi:MAG: CHC2 zinc finger domain-containing protein [Desulfobacterota bacterium]|jgi:DNA primase|nr:CHC2 zinc finger domain-containing protein [Thermodesulfobacteriota bacterium]
MLSAALREQLLRALHVRELAERRGLRIHVVPGGWTVCCPFHDDQKPSLHIYSDPLRGFHCFASTCKKSGDVLTWLTELDGMSFHEAVEYLAHLGGVDLGSEWRVYGGDQGPTDRDAAREKRERFCGLLEAVDAFFRAQLWQGDTPGSRLALEALKARALPDAIAQRLGYAPDQWDSLAAHLRGLGYSYDEMVESGLVRRSQRSGRPVDFLRHRLVIPIRNRTGRPVSFAGRALEGAVVTALPDSTEASKYLNGPETFLFRKRDLLFGLAEALSKRTSRLPWVLAEGYFDVLSLEAAGMPAVGVMGSALTEEQAQEIARGTDSVIIWLDPDQAGMKATEKALPKLLAANLRVVILRQKPAEAGGSKLDPDETVRRYGGEAVKRLLASPRQSQEWTAWIIAHLKETHRLREDSVQDRMRLLQLLGEFLCEGYPRVAPPRLILEALAAEAKTSIGQLLSCLDSVRKEAQGNRQRQRQEAALAPKAGGKPSAEVLPLPALEKEIWLALEYMADGDARGLDAVRNVPAWEWEVLPHGHLVLEIAENGGVPASPLAVAVMREAKARRAKRLEGGDAFLLHLLVHKKVLTLKLGEIERELNEPYLTMDLDRREAIVKEKGEILRELAKLGGLRPRTIASGGGVGGSL